MSKSNNVAAFRAPLSINELRRAIPIYTPHITMVIQSEPGCGKSSLLKMIAEDNDDQWRRPGDYFPKDKYVYIYVDCPTKDLSDIGMPIPVHETKTLEFYSNSLFHMDDPRPKVVMLDEMMKAPKLLQIMFTRLMLERMVGERRLADGSMVFATSNNVTDGVGDTMQAHAGNRVMMVQMRKPTADEWLVYATNAGIDSMVRAWVKMTPSALASYMDGDSTKENPYIFRPDNRNLSFVSPRSLEKSSPIVSNRKVLGDHVTKAALAGTLGVAAAESMSAFFHVEEDLESPKDILKDPLNAKVSKRPLVYLMTMFNLVDVIETQEDLTRAMQYVNRVPQEEAQSVFFCMIIQSARTMKLAKSNKQINDWTVKNYQLLI